MKKRICAILLAVMMVMTLLPVGALAAGTDGDFVIENGVLVEYVGPGGNVVIPDGVTAIGIQAFCYCDGLNSVVIPNGVTAIGWEAFVGCYNLASVTIPDSVTSIGDSAFEDCDSLTSVTIPASVTSIGDGAFDNCASLTAIEVSAGNKNYASIDGVLFSGDKTLLIRCPGGKSGSYAVPSGTREIARLAFGSCNNLTSVTIPGSVTSISAWAFSSCDSLTSVTIPNSVTSINESTFAGCDSLTSVTIPNSVTSIGDSAFRGCLSLANANIPSSVTSIGESAFAFNNMTSVAIPDGVTSIKEWVFSDCYKLTTVTIPASVTSIEMGAFLRSINLKDVYYGGSEAQWKQITIDSMNEPLLSATIHYTGTTTPPVTEPEPTKPTEPPVTEPEPTEPEWTNPYGDVKEGKWYYDDVKFMYESGLMVGKDDGSAFGVGENLIRGDMMLILYRMAGEPKVTGKCVFSDVTKNYYKTAIIWAQQKGIIDGDGGLFRPDANITRQEIAKVLYEYARVMGLDVSARGNLSAFSDGSATSGWAKEYMSWAVGAGVFEGGDGRLKPTDNALREEIAALLTRFCKNIAK